MWVCWNRGISCDVQEAFYGARTELLYWRHGNETRVVIRAIFIAGNLYRKLLSRKPGFDIGNHPLQAWAVYLVPGLPGAKVCSEPIEADQIRVM